MPLDPVMQRVLNQISALPMPSIAQMTPEVFRDQPLIPEPLVEVKHAEDIALPLDGRTLRARLYVPASAGVAPTPVVVYYHGGGFVYGNPDTHDSVCRVLANESACTVISVDYRLAPEHKFPEPVDDAYDALVYIAGAADKLGIDPSRLAVAGDSAGGNLAAVTCLLAKERGGPEIAYQLLMYPVTGVSEEQASVTENAEGYFLTADLIHWFGQQYQRSDEDLQNPLMSPLLSDDLSGLPPAFVATAQFDPLRDCGLLYAEALRKAGVPTENVNYDDLIHGFANFQAFVPRAKAALVECAHRVGQALHR